MAAGDITVKLLNQLGIRLSDTGERSFEQDVKLIALNYAQTQLGLYLNNAYLSELEDIAEDKALDDATAGTIQFSTISTTGIFKGDQGIVGIDIKIGGTGDYIGCHQIDTRNRKDLENTLRSGKDNSPKYYVFNENVYIKTTTLTGTLVRAYYLSHPPEMTTSVDPVLNSALYSAMLDLAEAQCWAMDGKAAERATAMENAMLQIKTLNDRYEAPIGVGTKRQ